MINSFFALAKNGPDKINEKFIETIKITKDNLKIRV
jgi:hypothetical protein